MPELTTIICRGTKPGTNELCKAKVCETDGNQFFITGHGYRFAIIEIDPPTIKCNVCGYKTRLGKQKSLQKSRV